MTYLDRYLARLIFLPMVGTLVVAAMLLLLDRMLRLFDFVATEGGPVSVVWRMLGNLLPEYLSLGIPLGLMLGILLAFRRLALSSELDVLRAVGLGYDRLLKVPFFYAAVLAAVNLAIIGYLQPVARYSYEQLRFELRSGALGASIKVGEFNRLGDRITLRIGESRENGSEMRGLFARVKMTDGQSVVVTADRGRFLRTADPNSIVLRLDNGTLVHDAPGYRSPRVLSFSRHDLPIDLPPAGVFRGRGGADREYTLPELVRIGSNSEAPPQTRDAARANFHFRVAQIAIMFLLPLLAAALAVPPKRSSSALGVFLSIVLVVSYFKLSEYMETVGASGAVHPVLAIWGPFAAFVALIAWMYRTAAHVPGGQPIGALERAFAGLTIRLRRLLGMARRRESRPAAA